VKRSFDDDAHIVIDVLTEVLGDNAREPTQKGKQTISVNRSQRRSSWEAREDVKHHDDKIII
jgi:hypothetical protein